MAIQNGKNGITLFGKTYEVIGEYHAGGGTPILPFLSVPDDLQMNAIAFMFAKNVTSAQYQDLVQQADAQIPGMLTFEQIDFPDSETIYIYNNIMLIAALIAALTVINFAVLYHFIVQQRMRQLAVLRICGCTAGHAFRIYLGECVLLCVPVYLLGVACYIPLMKSVLSELFPYMAAAYSLKIYLAIFGIYLIILLVIMSAMLVRQVGKKPIDTWKGGVI